MEGDFTRNSDVQEAAYSGVLLQQGRVQLDADWNEQVAIQTRALRHALRDLIGPHGGPAAKLGFTIPKPAASDPNLTIGTGVYYVDGIRVEQRDEAATLSLIPNPESTYLAFLDVWERHVNAIEDPRIREVALLGPDTATRSEVLWRVRLLSIDNNVDPIGETPADEWANGVVDRCLRLRPRRRLAARAVTVDANTDPCQLSPLAQYRGRENQLYRVQIHAGWPVVPGKVKGGKSEPKLIDVKGPVGTPSEPALFTFKWSRDNGSVVFPIVHTATSEASAVAGDHEIEVTVELGNLGRDDRFGLVAGDIVEFVHDALTRETLDDTPLVADGRDPGRAGLLGRVLAPIDRDDLTVRIAVYADDVAEIVEGPLHPYLRRWDHRPSTERKLLRGAIPVRPSDLDKWLPLENGVEILFEGSPKPRPKPGSSKPAQPAAKAPEQRAGDYWQIPARADTGDVLWPTHESGAPPLPTPIHLRPHGPHHHYAPLAIVVWTGNTIDSVTGVRRTFAPVAVPE